MPPATLTPSAIVRGLDAYVIGQDDAKKVVAVAVYTHFRKVARAAARDAAVTKSNVLMIGPSGTGKTLMCETLSRILGVPFASAEATALAQTRFVNEEIEAVLQRLIEQLRGFLKIARLDQQPRLVGRLRSGGLQIFFLFRRDPLLADLHQMPLEPILPHRKVVLRLRRRLRIGRLLVDKPLVPLNDLRQIVGRLHAPPQRLQPLGGTRTDAAAGKFDRFDARCRHKIRLPVGGRDLPSAFGPLDVAFEARAVAGDDYAGRAGGGEEGDEGKAAKGHT